MTVANLHSGHIGVKKLLKLICSEKTTKFCKIFTLLLSYVAPVKSKMKISQNFVAFSEYMNFKVAKIFFLFHLQFHQALLKFDFMKVLTKLCWALGQIPLARKKALRGHFEAVSCIIELEVHWPFHPVRHYLSENRAVGKSRAHCSRSEQFW